MKSAAEFFDAIARRYDRAYALDARASRARMARVLEELPAHARVLDLGVGTGRELSALQDAGHVPVGLDISPAMIDLCARRTRPIPLVLGDLWLPLPFPDASFEVALALHGTLAHPPDDAAPARLARELARVLTADGVFVAELPSHAWLDRIAEGAGDAEDRRVRRVGPDRCVYEDVVAGVSIEAWIPDDARWRDAFEEGGLFTVTTEPLGDAEIVLVARRARRARLKPGSCARHPSPRSLAFFAPPSSPLSRPPHEPTGASPRRTSSSWRRPTRSSSRSAPPSASS
jgi:SAM-dependent methyltransferase